MDLFMKSISWLLMTWWYHQVINNHDIASSCPFLLVKLLSGMASQILNKHVTQDNRSRTRQKNWIQATDYDNY